MVVVLPIIEPGDVLHDRPIVEALIRSGIRFLQIRGGPARRLIEAATVLAPLAAEAGVTLIVNDRVDVAAAAGVGVHLGQSDVPPVVARRLLGPNATIGVSTHDVEEARAVENANYLSVGPIFATASKPDAHPVVGLETLRAVARTNAARGDRPALPIVAIGGVTQDNFRGCLSAGATYVAAIGVFRAGGRLRPDAAQRAGLFS